jgi:hypothetical protein
LAAATNALSLSQGGASSGGDDARKQKIATYR